MFRFVNASGSNDHNVRAVTFAKLSDLLQRGLSCWQTNEAPIRCRSHTTVDNHSVNPFAECKIHQRGYAIKISVRRDRQQQRALRTRSFNQYFTYIRRPFIHRPLALGNLERSEEHTSELQSLAYLVCRLLLEKKKKSTKKNQCPNTTHQ